MASSLVTTTATVELSNGVRMPTLGFGTYKTRGFSLIKDCLKWAVVECGYRAVDTAKVYRNEADIGRSLFSELGVHRHSVFLTSKLSPADHGSERTPAAIEASLSALQTDYLDLYLIHWPGVSGVAVTDPGQASLRQESWRVLLEYQRKGKIRAVGVSNYEIRHLQELEAAELDLPQVNQVELHPLYQNLTLVNYCKERNIHVTAYSSLGTTPGPNDGGSSALLGHSVIVEAAKTSAITPAQLLLKWTLSLGHSVLPKSTDRRHIVENSQLDNIKLNEDVIEALNALDCGHKLAWDPRVIA